MRIAFALSLLLVASGCRAAPPAKPLAARIVEIQEVNTAGAYVDTIALSRDGGRVAIGQRNGSIRVWTPANGPEPATFGTPRGAVSDLAFAPSEITVRVGDIVEWANADFVDHTATAKSGDWDVLIPAGKSGRVELSRAGTVLYYCRFHPGMTGTIHVVAADLR